MLTFQKKSFLIALFTFYFLNHFQFYTVFAFETDSYVSQDLKITIQEVREENQRYWIVEVIGSEGAPLRGFQANQQVEIACEEDFVSNTTETVSSMASRVGAILAINASGFHKHNGIKPMGIVIRNQDIISKDNSFKKESLSVMPNGNLKFYKLRKRENIDDLSIVNNFNFGPVLLRNGDRVNFEDTSRHPRTAIGQISNHHYLIVIAEGRLDDAIGMTFKELQDIFIDYDCKNAYNLDGGGSTTLYFKGNILNRLSDGSERAVIDMIYF